MNALQAKVILLALIGTGDDRVFSAARLERDSPFLHVTADAAEIDGSFSADQLEAIACWMRDPAAVLAACGVE